MTDAERIAALEARLAAAEGRVAALEAARVLDSPAFRLPNPGFPGGTANPIRWPFPSYPVGDFPCAICGSLVCGGFHVTNQASVAGGFPAGGIGSVVVG